MSKKRSELIQSLKAHCLAEQTRRHKKMKLYNWKKLARPSQLPPKGAWLVWMILAGRGFGKTRTGAETIRQWVFDGRYRRIALVGQSLDDVRRVMVEGSSGLLKVHPPHERPRFYPSKRYMVWPNGARAELYSASDSEKLRGPQFDLVWVDELAKFRHPKDLWEQLMLCLRLGQDPRCIVTTTPRPIPLIRELMESPLTKVTRGSTFDNKKNLAKTYLKQIVEQFKDTRLGAQELYAHLLTEQDGALWTRDTITYKKPPVDEHGVPQLTRLVIAIDPATTHTDKSDETGIVVAGVSEDKKVYVLEDFSGRWSPADWGQRVVTRYWQLKVDRVVAEVNKGGDMVERILRSIDPMVSYKAVRATRGKITRAEPVAALYEQGKVFHARPFGALEDQLCTYAPGNTSKSPDRLDALVWAITDLVLEGEASYNHKVWMMT